MCVNTTQKICENCRHLAPNGLKCTGGFVPTYGWCDPVEKGAIKCPMYSPKEET